MLKKLTVFIIIISMMCSTVSAFDYSSSLMEIYSQSVTSFDETVTVIVEIDGDPVLSSQKAVALGADYLSTTEAKYRQQNILKTQYSVLNDIESITNDKNIQPLYTYTAIFNGFSIDVAKEDIDDIKRISDVKNVYITYPMEVNLETAVAQTSSLPSQTADDINTTGYTGEGQTIAIIDTVFDIDHEFFATAPSNPKYSSENIKNILTENTTNVKTDHISSVYRSPKIPFAYNYADTSNGLNVSSIADDHGTHVAGIAGGQNEEMAGVAPNTQLLLMSTVSQDGYLSTPAIFAAINDAVILGADVINLSLGSMYISSFTDITWNSPLEIAKNMGITVCCSAGNSALGFNKIKPSATHPDYSPMGVPADCTSATTVGAVENMKKIADNSFVQNSTGGQMSSSSSWGVNESLELKPEISAPGKYIYSSAFDGKYVEMGGTSMASPHLAGTSALMYEYLDKHKISVEGASRVQLAENLLMSSAKIVRQQSNNIPYSPRLQGAGLVNTASAIKTPAYIIGDSGKSKISLKDKLTETFTISFEIKNLTDTDVTYDNLSLEVLTDIANDGKVSGASKYLTVKSTTMPLSVTVSPDGASVTFNVTLDGEELEENSNIFTNGFFIDGFVTLGKSDQSIPEISVPFTGFYGDWTKASVFDKTMYDEGGSELYANTNNGTVILSNIDDTNIVCGKFDSTYDRNRIAISPDGDGLADNLGINLLNFRTCKNPVIKLVNQQNITKYQVKYTSVIPKFNSVLIGFNEENLEKLDEGNYTFVCETTFNYDGAKTEAISLPVVIDKQKPQFTDVDLNENQLTVKAIDNHQIDCIQIISGENVLTKYIPTDIGNEVTATFTDLDKINPENATILLIDCAKNIAFADLDSALDKIIVSTASDSNELLTMGNASFDLVNTADTVTGDIIIACYNSADRLIAFASRTATLPKSQRITVDFTDIGNVDDITETSYVKLFIWNNLNNIVPLDTAKAFIVQ